MRCGYCHNPHLVHTRDSVADEQMPIDQLIDFLRSRQGLLDAVCISGGEPTLSSELFDHVVLFKQMGFRTKLDTNGSRPHVIRRLVQTQLLDYVAMDIKAPPQRYQELTGWDDVQVNKQRNEVSKWLRSTTFYDKLPTHLSVIA